DYGSSAYGSFILDINGNRLDGKYLKVDGTIGDEFTIMKGDTTATVIENVVPVFTDVKIYPNPFSNQTKVEYSIETKSDIEIKLFDISGREIKALVSEEQAAGTYTYVIDGRNLNLAEGTYLLRFINGKNKQLEKIIKFE
ncbi:MAG TPA: T9SS type A sorting domain-containing protein, partial [Flavobacterium sp.]|nr:T9SS type A sorting domain-containing protein [Flavobacterium sp.]